MKCRGTDFEFRRLRKVDQSFIRWVIVFVKFDVEFGGLLYS